MSRLTPEEIAENKRRGEFSKERFVDFLQRQTCRGDITFEPCAWAAVPMQLSEHERQLMWLAFCAGWRAKKEYSDS